LRPSVTTGISHARFPLIVKGLLQWQKLWSSQLSEDAEWARINDLVDFASDMTTPPDGRKKGPDIGNIQRAIR